MEINLVILACCSFILGVAGKYADLVNEHGLKEHFKGAGSLSGYAWGLAGMGMLISSPLGGLTYVAHILYWFWRVKLEYPNHALAGVIMILSAFFFRGEFLQTHALELISVFSAYLVTGYIQTYFKVNYPSSRWFWRLRLRIYIIPIVYSLYTKSWDPVIATGFGMIGCEWITIKYKAYWEDKRNTASTSG